MWQDIVNATFELLGSIAIWCNVAALYKDREVKGVNAGTFLFFTVWGFWNLYYYPHLGQWASAVAGLSIALANTTWVYLYWRYNRVR